MGEKVHAMKHTKTEGFLFLFKDSVQVLSLGLYYKLHTCIIDSEKFYLLPAKISSEEKDWKSKASYTLALDSLQSINCIKKATQIVFTWSAPTVVLKLKNTPASKELEEMLRGRLNGSCILLRQPKEVLFSIWQQLSILERFHLLKCCRSLHQKFQEAYRRDLKEWKAEFANFVFYEEKYLELKGRRGEEFAKEIQVAVLGAGGVGAKTSMIKYLCTGVHTFEYDPTIEETRVKTITVDGKAVLLNILDTAGYPTLHFNSNFTSFLRFSFKDVVCRTRRVPCVD